MKILVHWLVMSWAAMILAVSSQCPEDCICPPGQIRCERSGISQIPRTANGDVKHLNMDGSPLAVVTLSRSDFSHLINLEELILSNCGIEAIGPNTFAGEFCSIYFVLKIALQTFLRNIHSSKLFIEK